jgi:hypothetical protein
MIVLCRLSEKKGPKLVMNAEGRKGVRGLKSGGGGGVENRRWDDGRMGCLTK